MWADVIWARREISYLRNWNCASALTNYKSKDLSNSCWNVLQLGQLKSYAFHFQRCSISWALWKIWSQVCGLNTWKSASVSQKFMEPFVSKYLLRIHPKQTKSYSCLVTIYRLKTTSERQLVWSFPLKRVKCWVVKPKTLIGVLANYR